MLCFLFYFSASATGEQPLPDDEMKSGLPSFQSTDDKSLEKFFNNSDIVTQFPETDIHIDDRIEYYFSHVTLRKNTIFKDIIALGGGMAPGIGGAIYVFYSNLQATSSTVFENNTASRGGALAIIESAAYLKSTCFINNTALRDGGSIFVSGFMKSKTEIDKDYSLLLENCTFISNSAYGCGGAIYSQLISSFVIIESNFSSNMASFNGGAIYCENITSIQIDLSIFVDNLLHLSKIQNYTITATSSQFYSNSSLTYINPNRKRGGGAIYAKSSFNSNMVTNDCCFANNSAKVYPSDSASNGRFGHEILIAGKVHYVSIADFISSKLYSKDLLVNNFGSESTVLIQHIDHEATKGCYEYLPIENQSVIDLNISFANTSFTTSMHTSNVPEPTTYTYAATPITQIYINKNNAKNPPRTAYDFHDDTIPKSLNPMRTAYPTLMNTPTKTPDGYKPPSPTKPPTLRALSKYEKYTMSETNISTIVLENKTIGTRTIVGNIYSWTYIVTLFEKHTYAIVLAEMIVEDKDSKLQYSAGLIILLSTIGMGCILIVAMIGLYLIREKRRQAIEDQFYSLSSWDSDELSHSNQNQTRSLTNEREFEVPQELLENVQDEDDMFMNNDF